jgi:hypothetical protein
MPRNRGKQKKIPTHPAPGQKLKREPLPTKCIFCNKKNLLTKEDFWPTWLQKIAPSKHTSMTHLTRYGILDPISNTMNWHNKRGRFDLPISPLSARLKVVCAECNNGWMSELQGKAKPFLLLLMEGRWTGITREAQAAIAAWATMFTMVCEFADMTTQAVTQSERDEFMLTKQPPDN